MPDRPTDKEINNLIGQLIDEPGPRWPAMTYEQGIRNALEWILGEDDDPLTD